MNSLKVILFITFSCFAAGCATTHPGFEGRSLGGNAKIPIVISAQTIGDPQDEPFQLIEVTLENLSDEWVRVSRSEVVIKDPATSKLSVVMGSDLKDWAQAMQMRLQKDEYNRQLLQIGLSAAGTAIALSGAKNDNKAAIVGGAALIIGTSAWAVSDVIVQSYSAAQQSEKVPENHLYRPFAIPGKMFQRKWVLMNKPSNGVIRTLVLEVDTVSGDKETYEIVI